MEPAGGKVFILGHDHGAGGRCVLPNRIVIRPGQAHVGDMLGDVAGAGEPAGQCGRQLGVDEKMHVSEKRRLGALQNGMVRLHGRIAQRRADIFGFQVRKVLQNFLLRHARG